jgi:hypothetical protein
LTSTTLAQVFRRHSTATSTAGTVRLVVRWDRETGWAHLGIAVPGTGCTRFAGFHRFTGGGEDAVVAELTAAGCVTASAPRLDDELMELEAVLALPEVTTDAAR